MTNFMMVYVSIGEFLGAKSFPQRYVLAMLSFASSVCMYMIRVCLAISMTQMVKPITSNASTLRLADDAACPMRYTDTAHAIIKNVTLHAASDNSALHAFDWSQEQQGFILSAFYIGYVIAHFPGGLLAERIGGKPVILLAIFTSSLLSILTPLAVVHGGVYGLFAVRVLLGCVQAGMYPAIATLLAAWIPKRERARVGGIVYCSGPCGAILGNSAAGFLIFSYQSWQVSFYTFGVVGIIIGILYTILCASNPNAHPNITEAEKEYLQREIGQLEREKNLKAVPWREMCTSKPVIALFLSLVVGDWAYYTILVDLPKYMNDVLHVSIRDNGVLTSLPWAMFMLVSVSAGFGSDRLIASGCLTVTNTRKLLVTISCAIGGTFIIAAAYAGCDITVVGTFFTIAVGAQGLNSASLTLNPMDLSPNYAGMLVGVIGTFSCCMGIVVPVAISRLAPNSLQSEWRNVFWITFAVSAAKILIFDTMGSAKVQSWNYPQEPVDAENKCNDDGDGDEEH